MISATIAVRTNEPTQQPKGSSTMADNMKTDDAAGLGRYQWRKFVPLFVCHELAVPFSVITFPRNPKLLHL
jgi:hypothetical protein